MKINSIKLFSFLITLLISVDVIQFSGLRITLIPLLFVGILIFIKNNSIDKNTLYVFLFALLCIPSLLFTVNIIKSSLYIFWIFLNYLSILIVYSQLIQKSKYETIIGIRDAYKLQIIVGCFLYFSGIQERAQVLFYEPSYFAIALIPYIVMIFSKYINNNTDNNEKYTSHSDIIFLVLAIFITKSFNLIIICFLVPIILFAFEKGKLRNLLIFSLLGSVIYQAFKFYISNSDDLISKTFQNIIDSGDVITSLLERTGNRWPRMQLTNEIALQNFWGVGIGTMDEYSLNHYFSDFSYLPDYLSPIGYPPINIYLEIAATCGWLALAVWLLWHFYIIKQNVNSQKSDSVITCSLIVIMIIMMIESSFLRPYYWMLLGLAVGQIKINKKLKT